MKPEMYDWQKSHVDKLCFAVKKFNSAVDASDMGTGKTLMALEVAHRCGLKPVIICPKSVVNNWEKWSSAFFPNFNPIVYNYEKLTRGKSVDPTHFVKKGVRKSMKMAFLFNRDKVLFIFDECHRCKGENSLNAKLLASAVRDKFRILMLSATACSNPLEMRAVGYALGLHGWRDHWSWCLRHGCRRGYFGGLDFKGSETVLKRLHDDVFGSGLKGSRIRISDLPEGTFPDNFIDARPYDVNDSARDYALSVFDKDPDDEETPLVALLRERQRAELFKVPVFCDLIYQAYKEGNSPVLFVNFVQTLHEVERKLLEMDSKLCTLVSTISGDEAEIRDSEIERFQSNERRICLCMIQAGGVGLSLHDVHGTHPRVSIISPGYSAIEFRQALGRIHRAGGKSSARQYVVFANDTVEEGVCRAVNSKLNNLDLLNDGDLMDPETKEIYENSTDTDTADTCGVRN